MPAFTNHTEKATVTDADPKQGSVYDYGSRDNNVTTLEGGENILNYRFLDDICSEFCQEWLSRQDMIRFGVFSKKSWFSHQTTNDKIKDLYPIPNVARLTNSNLNQNEGYVQ